ncbi:MAG TPA: invasion associated locus B family protein [Hyphomicrobiaceae bacterium]|nr:invasion associated locus B family protein [Hyphomicrobiaceae bacterium]
MAATMAAAVLAAPASLAQSIEVIATSGEWRAYAHGTGARRICFAAATAGTGAFAYITAWPKDGVRSEFSLKTASAARKGSEALVTVGREQFRLFTDADRAWVGDVATEARLIEAMKKGARMTVQVTAEKGAAAPEVYSLSGMTQALLAMGQACQ